MSFLDIVLGLLLLWGLYKGLRNGLIIEVATLVALIAGLYGAIRFSYITGQYLEEHMSWDQQYMNLIAFIITFILIVLVVNLLARLLTKIVDFALMGWLNKLAGAVFGTLKIAVMLGTLLLFLERANTSIKFYQGTEPSTSVLYAPLRDIGALVFEKVIPEITEPETEKELQFL
ncbi:CvpA family protein [Zeaxanthinibacter enoshimensis]|uniref:Membrane protein required for colicin V production n=1 Tax=Zeaxanthinibacter enoshimensis TaxID=392009 RepID=A0A4R6TVJ7_9FLAO|nr:CvpA family protein [Zeaxanthinibacter enoshimensis]TDQ32958.1 membrane protein required for colicin V production [Zeaxanthinibacter enoshimensis]